MPAVAPYIPPKDADLNNWLANFSSLITAGPATYGLVAADATSIAAATASWTAAYNLVTSPATKTATTVQAKNVQRVNVLAIARPYAQTIANNAGVSPSNKIALGLNPRTSTPTPVTAPTTNPILSIVSSPPMQLIARYRDSIASPSVKSKPYGVLQVQIFAETSLTAITNPAVLPLFTQTTKSPVLLQFDSSKIGLTAYMAARWVTRTGLVGPWSPIVSYVISG